MATNEERKQALRALADKYRAMGTPQALERAGDIESWLLDILKAENELQIRVLEGQLEISIKLSEAELKAVEPFETPESVTPD